MCQLGNRSVEHVVLARWTLPGKTAPELVQVDTRVDTCAAGSIHDGIADATLATLLGTCGIGEPCIGRKRPESPNTSRVPLVRLPCRMTLGQLSEECNIDWDAIAGNPTRYLADFVNKYGNGHTFKFEKFLKNGNCKGEQEMVHRTGRGNTQKVHTKTGGLSPDQVSYPAGTLLPVVEYLPTAKRARR
jgi:hypothetical protein